MARGRPKRSGIDWNDPAAVREYKRKQYANDKRRILEQNRQWRRENMPPLSEPERSAALSAAAAKALPGKRRALAKLTPDQVRAIRIRYDAGFITQAELGEQYGVDVTTIHQIVRRKIWKDID